MSIYIASTNQACAEKVMKHHLRAWQRSRNAHRRGTSNKERQLQTRQFEMIEPRGLSNRVRRRQLQAEDGVFFSSRAGANCTCMRMLGVHADERKHARMMPG
mmetsp:Transcript_162377/g.311740  ORF Transcript_162377/g.311740 Transcript_162377/m.311740 type:complete len:102 (+) Transcript_162377:98-403(+)